MRAFIGIEFPVEIKKEIIEVQRIIKENSIKGRWKYIDNFHLTLKFLGEVSERQIDSIFEKMKASLENIDGFTIGTGGLGYFKGQGCLRVVLLELTDEENNLGKVFNIVEECCYLSGIPKEKRRYTPHITVAQDVILLGEYDAVKSMVDSLPKLEIPVKKISIIKSEQIEGRRIYTPIRSAVLK